MASPVTEIVEMTLLPNANDGVIAESVRIIARQPGCRKVRTARERRGREMPEKLYYFIDWDAIDAHLAFARDPVAYGELST
jgi:hypothetical protein